MPNQNTGVGQNPNLSFSYCHSWIKPHSSLWQGR